MNHSQRTRVYANKRKLSQKTIELYQHKKKEALAYLRKRYSAGWVHRFLEVPDALVIYWRDEAGIPPLPQGGGRPSPSPKSEASK